ncbi:hypothetical protein BLA18112_06883 [Burkholderia lata]|uniref:Uncharacterized protein n=1 Tax=Burkholderia lata (strain ATCC 17760 / DSM 23089 / LMG 22485 / NCIMB 9086 / R18194 / 383) TaxID=482957 RepID=A0A6P3A6F2_BURL3|nr:hypothetical protein BLA18112_06883 [Burkholderia lata]
MTKTVACATPGTGLVQPDEAAPLRDVHDRRHRSTTVEPA